MGPKVARFEREFARYVGARHAIAVDSCTSALFLSLLASGIGPGDEVITTPFTLAVTVNVIEHLGATPVFADIDLPTLNLDPDLVRRAISPRAKAILLVHFGGLACDLDAIGSIADSAGLALIEDAAHAVGTRHRGRMIGGTGRLTAFSFYSNKNLTTGEGGMITTADDSLAGKLETLRLHGLTSDAWKRFTARGDAGYEAVTPGYKCNMTDLAASLGIHQLRKQEAFLAVRARYARCYDDAFGRETPHLLTWSF
ncbi:DegT/DnrJ/EryC1/StrS aminotransferase family protein [Actinokineospora iranica]|uniref:DegT/DnrJ/EryC1/StrS aminotransferase family protein n=2 Tax=Actinokineospora iranica TaxID=1271860 RepID=A0A1G6KTM0_9PSEU|nr:DegT/DnrJ/EryC1/StrS aminotransferase family protein [Actinokineospora iranica]